MFILQYSIIQVIMHRSSYLDMTTVDIKTIVLRYNAHLPLIVCSKE